MTNICQIIRWLLQANSPAARAKTRSLDLLRQIRPADDSAEIVIIVGGVTYVRGNQIIGHGICLFLLTTLGCTFYTYECHRTGGRIERHGTANSRIVHSRSESIYRPLLSDAQLAILRKSHCYWHGTDRPFSTTDTAALNPSTRNAVRRCGLKQRRVAGVCDQRSYEFDAVKWSFILPRKPNKSLTLPLWIKQQWAIMDEHIPVIICDLLTDGSILPRNPRSQ